MNGKRPTLPSAKYPQMSQYALISRTLGSCRQETPCQCNLCTTAGLSFLAARTLFVTSNSPLGMYFGGSRRNLPRRPKRLPWYQTSLVQEFQPTFIILNDCPAWFLKPIWSEEDRRNKRQFTLGVCTPLSSPPWLAWLTPLWT